VHRVLVGKSEGQRSLGRNRREDKIKMDLWGGRGVGNWMELAQNRERWLAIVSRMMNFRVP